MNPATEMTDYMALKGLLSDEEKLVQQTAREFVNREVIPIIDSYAQEEKFPRNTAAPASPMLPMASSCMSWNEAIPPFAALLRCRARW
jgi:hypothetical protein